MMPAAAMVPRSFPRSRPLARQAGAKQPRCCKATCCRRPASPHRRPGFTILETLVVIAIIVVLGAFMLVGLHQVTAVSTGTNCLNNLSRVHDAFVNYAGDNQGMLPSPALSHVSWEQSLKTYLPDPKAFQCPSDQELFSTIGSSYDWRDAGLATTSLAGVNLSRAPQRWCSASTACPAGTPPIR